MNKSCGCFIIYSPSSNGKKSQSQHSPHLPKPFQAAVDVPNSEGSQQKPSQHRVSPHCPFLTWCFWFPTATQEQQKSQVINSAAHCRLLHCGTNQALTSLLSASLSPSLSLWTRVRLEVDTSTWSKGSCRIWLFIISYTTLGQTDCNNRASIK
jgi:hypothetical protein